MTRRGALTALAVASFGVLVSVLVAEVTLRVYAHASHTFLAQRLRADPLGVLVEPHGEAGYRPKPERAFRYDNGTVAHSNAMSFRGPLVDIPKPPGTTRILLFGGSTTHGWGVADDETIDVFMREELTRRYPDRRFEVVNFGVDGYDSYQIFERLRSDGLGLEPDIVIVNTGVNDVRNARYPDLEDKDARTIIWWFEIVRAREEERRGGPTLWNRTKHYSYLARVPGAVRAQLTTRRSDTPVTPQPDAMDHYQRNLSRIIDIAQSSAAVVLLSTEPSSLLTKYDREDTSYRSYWIGNAETTQAYRDSLRGRLLRVADSARGAGAQVATVPYLELHPDLFLDDAHLTADGNRRLAQHFVESLAPYLVEADATGPSSP